MTDHLLRDVEVDGRLGLDVRLRGGLVAEIGRGLAPEGEVEIDGRGGALIPGLCDHHIHLLAAAAQDRSVNLSAVDSPERLAQVLADAAARTPPGDWIRATGYHEGAAGDLDRRALDALVPGHRLRAQHRSGALWVLNTAALDSVCAENGPQAVERGADGRPTGRIWRGDAWLRARLDDPAPSLETLGRRLAAYGVTSVTDASATTDTATAAVLADAHRSGALPQRLTLMSAGPLTAPPHGNIVVGPVKMLLDEQALPSFDEALARLRAARAWGRPLAVHAVTAVELAFALALFATEGARRGDRIEHGGVIPAEAIQTLRALDLVVVTQSAFVTERGDRYLAETDPADMPDLYRCASLLAAGVAVAGSSDAPYTDPDPWAAMAAAMTRRTRSGQSLGATERIGGRQALALYLGAAPAPGRAPRRVRAGAAADLCLSHIPLAKVLQAPNAACVQATFIDGRIVHRASEEKRAS